MRIAGKVAADTLTYLESFIQPGITTKELDHKAEIYIRSRGCSPACLGYEGYPASVCTSVNSGVVHCIPDNKKLKSGDIVTIDLCTMYEGFGSDTANTFCVGDVKPEVKKFVNIGYQSLREAIKKVKDGNFISDLSSTISDIIESNGYGVVRTFVGHGIGKQLHEFPSIPNFKLQNKGSQLVPGMVICIEPILTMGSSDIRIDGRWNAYTEDNSLACHFEHSILVTEQEPEILTLRVNENGN